jgi:hypothetical protein
MSDAAPVVPAAAPVVPGKTLGIVALIVTFFFSVVGLILGIVARNQSKAAGVPNTPAKVAIILGIVFTALGILWFIVVGAGIFAAIASGNVTTY